MGDGPSHDHEKAGPYGVYFVQEILFITEAGEPLERFDSLPPLLIIGWNKMWKNLSVSTGFGFDRSSIYQLDSLVNKPAHDCP